MGNKKWNRHKYNLENIRENKCNGPYTKIIITIGDFYIKLKVYIFNQLNKTPCHVLL